LPVIAHGFAAFAVQAAVFEFPRHGHILGAEPVLLTLFEQLNDIEYPDWRYTMRHF
jgi:hypothetical protein